MEATILFVVNCIPNIGICKHLYGFFQHSFIHYYNTHVRTCVWVASTRSQALPAEVGNPHCVGWLHSRGPPHLVTITYSLVQCESRGQGTRLACDWSETETATILTFCSWFHSSGWFDHSSVVSPVHVAIVIDNSIEVIDGRFVWLRGCI